MIRYRFAKDITLESAAGIMSDEYKSNLEFKEAAIASIQSAITEIKGKQEDDKLATAIADRLFGD